MLAQQQTLLMAAATRSENGTLKPSAGIQQPGLNDMSMPTQNWPNAGYQIPGLTIPLAGQNELQNLVQMGNYQSLQKSGNPPPFPTTSFYPMGQAVPVSGGIQTVRNLALPSTETTKEYDFSSLTQGLFKR